MEFRDNVEISFLGLRLKRLPNGSIEKAIYLGKRGLDSTSTSTFTVLFKIRGLYKIFAYRVRYSCSRSVLDSELNKFRNTLMENRYPARFTSKPMKFGETDGTNRESKAEKKRVSQNLAIKVIASRC